MAIDIALLTGLASGFLDILTGILFHELKPLASFFVIVPIFTLTCAFFFIVYMGAWYVVFAPLNRMIRFDGAKAQIALAAFLLICYTLAQSFNTIRFSTIQLKHIIIFCIILIFTIIVSLVLYFKSKALRSLSCRPPLLRTAGLGMIFILFELLILTWLQKFHLNSLSLFLRVVISLCFFLVVFATAKLFKRLSDKMQAAKYIYGWVIVLLLLNPLLFALDYKDRDQVAPYFTKTHHKVKNVLLLTVDTLRPDHLSCYNPATAKTPNIDRLASSGILFRNAIAPSPWTLPTFASLMTGLPPTVHLATKPATRLQDTLLTMAEVMRDNDYFTAAIGTNIFLTPGYNVSQGFREYDFFPKHHRFIGFSFGGKILSRWISPEKFKTSASTTDLTRFAVTWLELNHKKDFFLWLHYFDPHMPYKPPVRFIPKAKPASSIGNRFRNLKGVRSGEFRPTPEDKEWIQTLYNCEVQYVDNNIGRIIQTLKRLNLYDETLIIFLSDHGEEFWEHDGFEHGHTLYNELIDVPLIFKLPGPSGEQQRRNIDILVTIQDIMPTVLDLCELPYASHHLSSGSLLPLLGPNPEQYVQKPVYSTALLFDEARETILFENIKFIRFLNISKEELYDLIKDPTERSSIHVSSPELLRTANAILDDYSERVIEMRKRLGIEYSDTLDLGKEALEDLRALGYIK